MTYVGIDLHKHSASCCYYETEENYHFNTFALPSESDAFYASVSSFDEIAIEAGGISINVQKQLLPIVKKITLVAPSKFPDIAKSYKKTDKHDSYCLAKALKENTLPIAHQKSDAALQLLSLIHVRKQLTLYSRNLKGLIASHALRYGLYLQTRSVATKKWRNYILEQNLLVGDRLAIELASEEISRVDTTKRLMDSTFEELGSKFTGYSLLRRLPGFGAYTAAVIIAEIDDINRFPSAKHLCSYFGVVPRVRQSASTAHNRRITKRGDKEARKCLVWATFFILRGSDYYAEKYQKIRRKRAGKVALLAISRKVLTLIYYILKNQIEIDDFSRLTKPDFITMMN